MAEIAGYLAFYPDKVTIEQGWSVAASRGRVRHSWCRSAEATTAEAPAFGTAPALQRITPQVLHAAL